jgi:DNA-binding MarR family transcriptional regulator
MTGALDDERLTAVGLFIEAFEGLMAEIGVVHARFGLSGKDFNALLRLARSPGSRLRMTDLATQTGMSTSGITRVVDRLEAEGLVERSVSDADRRSLLVAITRNGRRRLEADAAELVGTIEATFLAPLGRSRVAPFLADLRKLRDALRPEATAGADGSA